VNERGCQELVARNAKTAKEPIEQDIRWRLVQDDAIESASALEHDRNLADAAGRALSPRRGRRLAGRSR
jgi:hypothetical protein